MINIFKIIKFFKNQWFGSCVLVLWILYIIFSQQTDSKVIEKTKYLDKVILKEKQVIDTLYKTNTVIDNKIKYITKTKYDTIKIIDTMSASELQKFFTNRYN